MRRLRDIHPVTALAVLAAVTVFVKNAWVSEDAYIIFRSIEQLFTGHGPVWNPHERVQVFTSPLWFWTLAVVRIFSSNVFLNAIGMGLVLWLACLVVIRRVARSPGAFALIVLALLVSNGFADYTSSGLENSLLYFLLALFVLYYRQTGASQVEPAVLMAYIETSEGTAMHAHTARSDDPLAQRKAAEELINRLWRAYVRATEKAVA